MNDLNNKNVIITGASQGIGKKIAELYSYYKSNIFLISRNIKALEEIKRKLNKNSQFIIFSDGNINAGQFINNFNINNDIDIHAIGLGEVFNKHQNIKIYDVNNNNLNDSTNIEIKFLANLKTNNEQVNGG